MHRYYKSHWLILAFGLFPSLCGAQAEKSGPILFSPNGDGVLDTAQFHLGISNPGNVSQWEFSIIDSMAREVKHFSGKGAPPPVLEWDGKDEHNQLIPDGKYQYLLSVMTVAGNKVQMPPQDLICDRQAPTAQVGEEPSPFSPEEGSSKPTAHFTLDAFDANGINSWLLRIRGAKSGEAVKSFFGKGQPPARLDWGGRTDAGEPAPDGDYTFTLAVRDRAGNTTTTDSRTVTIDRAEPVTSVDARPSIFSPNGDGVQDTVSFGIKPPPTKKVIETWSLTVQNDRGKVVKSFEGAGEPPGEIIWDGKDTAGRLLPDGVYAYRFLSVDQAGNRGSTVPKTLILDNTPPEASVKLTPTLLSPNGDGYGDSGIFDLRVKEANGVKSYALEIRNDVGDLKKAFKGEGSVPAQLQWAGQGEDGRTLLDGKYSYTLTVIDNAGNKTVTAPQPIQIDTTPPIVDLMAEPKLISPNGDQKEARFQVSVQDASDIEDWRLEIKDSQGKEVRKFSGTGSPLGQMSWDGRSDNKQLVPDGAYACAFWARDKAHNAATTPPQTITVGAQIPQISVQAGLSDFSPNADGVKDSVSFALKVQAFNRIQRWNLNLSDSNGVVVRGFAGQGKPPAQVDWGGERDDKSPAPDGFYRYVLEVTDEAGNKNSTPPQTVQIDTARPQIAVRAEPALFSPNGDGVLDQATLRLSYQDASPAGGWSVAIKNEGNKVVKTFSGQGPLPAAVVWDGTSDAKGRVPDGPYTYSLWAEDAVGNQAVTPDQIVRVDDTPPEVALSANPTLFAPKTNSAQDRTLFSLTARDASNLSQWSLKIFNAKKEEVRRFKGEGRPPGEIVWEGTNEKGVVFPDGQYSGQLSAKDEVGNEGKSSPVTVVIDTSKPVLTVAAQEEEVPSLAPEIPSQESSRGIVIDLAAEVLFETGKAEIRLAAYPTLDEAAAVVKKYSGRHVLVEGHTDNVPIHTAEFPSNRELSKARAQAVVDYFVNARKIEVSRLTANGYGDTRPAADNATEEGRRKNRRVEIVIENEKKAAVRSPRHN